MSRHRNELPDLIHKGITFKVYTMRDEDHEEPWDDGDGRGVVTDWLEAYDGREVTDKDGHVLRRLGHVDRGVARYFDVTATREKAITEEWGLTEAQALQHPELYGPPDPATGHRPCCAPDTIAELATDAEYEFLNGWCNDKWEYIGVIVELPKLPGISASVWGIESNAHEYIQEVARELADQCIEEADHELEDRIAELRELRGLIDAAVLVP